MTAQTSRKVWHHAWTQIPFFLWLVVLWMLLWGQLTVLAALTGVAVAAFVMTVFRLPTAELSGRINLWHGLVFVVTFLGSLVQGALVIAWQILTPGLPGTAVVRVPLRSDDDLIMTHVAVTCSLIPGSVVVEADRERRILYLHVIGVENADDIEKQRRIAQRWEERAVRAVGSRADLELVRSDAPPYVSRMATGGAS